MGYTRSVTSVFLFLISSAPWLPAQDVVLPGSTAQGDILRGHWLFLLMIAGPDKPDAEGPIVPFFSKGGDNELWQVVSVNHSRGRALPQGIAQAGSVVKNSLTLSRLEKGSPWRNRGRRS
jgi:hypothetical protein